MDENKQIDGMARLMCKFYADDPNCCRCPDCWVRDEAKVLYEAGYRKQEWISVGDALPEEEEKEKFIYDPKTFAQLDVMSQDESEEVLVTVVNLYQNRAFVTVDHTINGIWQTWDCGDFMVTHWMPLPDAPKGE